MNMINVNGKICSSDKPVLMVDNKSYRYGDGFFETLKVKNSKILLEDFHFERFYSSVELMGFTIPAFFNTEKLIQHIKLLLHQNKCDSWARVRLSVFRGNGGLNEGKNEFEYVIECWPLTQSLNVLNSNGLELDIYPHVRKSCDKFSNLKSANYLPYVMAALYAKKNKLNECLVLNAHERIADSTISNVFIVTGKKLMTPSLDEGCVNGVMRKWLINRYQVKEGKLKMEDLLSANEIFLTNVIYGIRWVKQFRHKQYGNLMSANIHQELLETIWR